MFLYFTDYPEFQMLIRVEQLTFIWNEEYYKYKNITLKYQNYKTLNIPEVNGIYKIKTTNWFSIE